jgi:hypothetical protein
MTLPRRLALMLVLVLIAAAGAAPALAGEYPVYACEPGAGDVNRSWHRHWNHGGIEAYAHCPPGAETRSWNRGLVTRNKLVPADANATIPAGAWAALAFYAPAGASLSRITYTNELCGWGGFRAGIMNAANQWLRWSGPNVCGSWMGPHETLQLGGTTAVKLVTTCLYGPCRIGGPKPTGYATLRSATVVVADYTAPSVTMSGGTALAPGWRRGVVTVGAHASDNVGIRYIDAVLAGRRLDARSNTCDHTLAVPCPSLSSPLSIDTSVVPDGRQTLLVRGQDSADNWTTASRSILVDNNAPAGPIDLSLVGGEYWRASNSFSLTWKNLSQAPGSGIAGAETAVCPAENRPEVWKGCVYRRFKQPHQSRVTGLTVPGPGNWVGRVWLRDAAGNHDRRTAQSVPLRLDNNPPVLSFSAQNPADPTRVEVVASDPTSPLSRTEIEARRQGHAAWWPLATTRTANGFVAYLDDENLPNGVYELRARAFDSAGNERSTDRDVAGAVVTRTVPIRINTRLVAGHVKRVAAKRSRGGKRRTRRVIVVRPRVRYGRTIPIRGRLTTPGANPIANASVEVWERTMRPGEQWRRVALIGTNGQGRFRFKALRGPSRVLRFRYPGTPLVRARTTEVELRVKAGTTMRANRDRVVNGDEVVFRGRVQGRPLPSTGKLIQLQAYSRGTWLTFATPRASARTGRWSHRYRFTATRGTVRYRFRARLPREAGYPYDAGISRHVSVVVRGL